VLFMVIETFGRDAKGVYRRFRDKDGIIQALHERFCDDSRATADDALAPSRWEGEPLAFVVHEFTAFLVQIYREREGLLRAFLARAHYDLAMRHRTLALFEHLSQRLSALLRARRDEFTHPDLERAAVFGLQMVLSTLNCSVLIPPQPLPLNDERFAQELSRALASYLGVRAAKPRLRLSNPKRRKP